MQLPFSFVTQKHLQLHQISTVYGWLGCVGWLLFLFIFYTHVFAYRVAYAVLMHPFNAVQCSSMMIPLNFQLIELHGECGYYTRDPLPHSYIHKHKQSEYTYVPITDGTPNTHIHQINGFCFRKMRKRKEFITRRLSVCVRVCLGLLD